MADLTKKEQLDDHIQSAQAIIAHMQTRLTQAACKGSLSQTGANDLKVNCAELAYRFLMMGDL